MDGERRPLRVFDYFDNCVKHGVQLPGSDSLVNPSRELPIHSRLYPLASPLISSNDLGAYGRINRKEDYDPSDDGPSAA